MNSSRNRLQAGRLVRLMDVFEGHARQWESAEATKLRAAIASRYRKIIGVQPQQRHEFRAALHRIIENGNMPVAELVEQFNPKDSSPLPQEQHSQ